MFLTLISIYGWHGSKGWTAAKDGAAAVREGADCVRHEGRVYVEGIECVRKIWRKRVGCCLLRKKTVTLQPLFHGHPCDGKFHH